MAEEGTTTPRRARVDDVIEHGQDIPANVAAVRDQQAEVWGDRARGAKYSLRALLDCIEEGGEENPPRWYPMVVVEVDPEPQPAEPNPLVLTLPRVPDGAVALIGRTSADRYARSRPDSLLWWRSELNGRIFHISAVLREEGSVTVELAPPREPRVWEPIDPAPVGGPTRLRQVEVGGDGRPGSGERYTYDVDALDWVSDRGVHRSWGELRECRIVEVLGDA